MSRVLLRDDYYQIIVDILELERINLGDYLEEKILEVQAKNPQFIKCLYKDILKVLEGVDIEGDNEPFIEDGDFKIEYGDIKLTGKPTNLHYTIGWLHMKIIEQFTANTKNLWELENQITAFEEDFLKVNYDTKAYSQKLQQLNQRLKNERRGNTINLDEDLQTALKMINEANIYEAFAILDKKNIQNPAYAQLKKEFIYGIKDVDFHERLKTFVQNVYL